MKRGYRYPCLERDTKQRSQYFMEQTRSIPTPRSRCDRQGVPLLEYEIVYSDRRSLKRRRYIDELLRENAALNEYPRHITLNMIVTANTINSITESRSTKISSVFKFYAYIRVEVLKYFSTFVLISTEP
jgi:hypothetical protein